MKILFILLILVLLLGCKDEEDESKYQSCKIDNSNNISDVGVCFSIDIKDKESALTLCGAKVSSYLDDKYIVNPDNVVYRVSPSACN